MVELEHRPFRVEHPTEPGRIVRGSIDLPRPGGRKRPHAILLHGFKGFAAWGFFPEIARRIAERGCVVVRYDASGNGVGEDGESFTELEAFARNTLSREIEDLEAVRAWIRAGSVRIWWNSFARSGRSRRRRPTSSSAKRPCSKRTAARCRHCASCSSRC